MSTNSNANTTAKSNDYPAFHITGRLAADPVLRYTAPKGDKPAVPVLEFRVIANPTREALAAVGVNAAVFGKRAEGLKDKLAKGTLVEVSGDAILEAYKDKETGEARASLKLEVAFGKIVTFDDNKKAIKTSFFAKEEQQ